MLSSQDELIALNDQSDAIDSYFECITACSLDDEGVECVTKCVEVHLKEEIDRWLKGDLYIFSSKGDQ